MSIDVDANLIVGWIVDDWDGELAEPWLDDDDENEKVARIIGKDGYPSDWVGYAYDYSCNRLYIGYPVKFSGGSRLTGDYVDYDLDGVIAHIKDDGNIATAKRVYEAVCGEPPDTEPNLELFAKWW